MEACCHFFSMTVHFPSLSNISIPGRYPRPMTLLKGSETISLIHEHVCRYLFLNIGISRNAVFYGSYS